MLGLKELQQKSCECRHGQGNWQQAALSVRSTNLVNDDCPIDCLSNESIAIGSAMYVDSTPVCAALCCSSVSNGSWPADIASWEQANCGSVKRTYRQTSTHSTPYFMCIVCLLQVGTTKRIGPVVAMEISVEWDSHTLASHNSQQSRWSERKNLVHDHEENAKEAEFVVLPKWGSVVFAELAWPRGSRGRIGEIPSVPARSS